MSGVPAEAQDGESASATYQPYGEVVAHAGSDDYGVSIEGWSPIVQGDNTLLFLDSSIGVTDDTDGYTNLGLGVRAIVGNSVVLGGYGYFDYTRDEANRDFYGATFGAELMTQRFELRANYYLPTSDDKYLGTEVAPTGALVIDGNELRERRDTMSFDLTSMKGIDGEVGIKLFAAEDGSQDFRLYGGGYHFWDRLIDNIDGGYGEAEYRLNGVFGEGSSLALSGRVSDDNLRGTEVSGQLRLRLSFGKPRGAAANLTGLESRMTERVRRRGPIMVQTRATPGTRDFGVLSDLTGHEFGQFFFADGANSAGTGDPDDTTTLADAAARAGAGDTIVAEGGHGTIATTGVTLADGASLVGGGATTLQVRTENGGVRPYTLGTSTGTIVNSNDAADTLTLGDGNLVAGVNLVGGANGIVGAGISGVTIRDVTISDVGESGIGLTDVGAVSISDSGISGGSAGAIAIGGTSTAALSGLTLGSAGGTVLSLDGTGAGLTVTEFADLTILGDNGETGGVRVTQATFDANLATAAIENVDGGDLSIGATGRVGGDGLVLDGVLGRVAFGDVDIFTDGGTGLYIRDGEGKAGSFFFGNTSGTIDANGGAAVDIDPVTVASTFDSITSIGSPGAGLLFDTVAGSFTVTGRTTVTDPAADGIVIRNSTADFDFGATKITGFSGTGLDLTGAHGNAKFASLDIEGDGSAGSKGIDLSGSSNAGGFLGTTGPSSISGADIGIDLSGAEITGTFQFGDGSDTDANGAASSIDADTPIVATDLGITGTYNILDAELTGDITGLGGNQITVFFVDSTAGAGTASDPGTIAQAEASGASIIVLVDDGLGDLEASGSGADDTFVLGQGQRLTGFYGQDSFSYYQGGPQANLKVHGLAAGHEVIVEDPTGNGGASLVSSAGDAVTASGVNQIDHVIVGNSAGFGVMIDGIAGSVAISDAELSSLGIDGGSGTVSLANTDITGSTGAALSVTGGHSGTLTIDAASSITDTTGTGLKFQNAAGTYTIAAPISLTGGSLSIDSSPGTFDFTGAVTLTHSTLDAVSLLGANGDIGFASLNVVTPQVRGIEIIGATNDVMIGGGGIGDSASSLGAYIEAQAPSSTISFTDFDILRTTSNSASLSVYGAAGTIDVIDGTITNGGSSSAVFISNSSANITIGSSLTNSGSGTGIRITGMTGGSVDFTGDYTSTGPGNAISISSNSGGTITFDGDVTITGGANILVGGTNSLAFNGTTSVSGTNYQSLDIFGLNGTISFADLDIAVTTNNMTGLDLNGASFSGAFTATDFDLTSTSASGTIGVDLRNASGTIRLGDIASGGASASIAGVATGVLIDNTSNVAFTFGDGENAIDLGSVIDVPGTAIDFGDNDGSVGTFNFVDVDWSQAGNSLSYENLISDFTIYYIDAAGGGIGTAADPGDFAGAALLDPDVIILLNQNASGIDTIDLADIAQGGSGTFELQDGQGLFSFNGGDPLDLAQYGYSMGGAPSNFQFTAIATNETLIANPGTGTGAPILTSTANAPVITLSDGGHFTLGGVVIETALNTAVQGNAVARLLVEDSALSGLTGLNLQLQNNAATTIGQYVIRDSVLSGQDVAFGLSAGAGDSYDLTISGSSFSAVNYAALDISAADDGIGRVALSDIEAGGGALSGIRLLSNHGTLTISEFDDITVSAASSVAIEIAGNGPLVFDADPDTLAIETVVAGNVHTGTSAAPISGRGLYMYSLSGALTIEDLQSHTLGTALYVDNSAAPSLEFAFATLGGDISATAASSLVGGIDLRDIDADIVLNSVAITGFPTGVKLDSVTGAGTDGNALTIGTLTLDGTGGDALSLIDVAGAVTITGGAIGANDDPAGHRVFISGGAGEIAIGADILRTSLGQFIRVSGRTGGSVTFSGALSSSSGILVSDNTGGSVNFTGPVTLSTGGAHAVELTNNTGAAINFSGGLDVTTTTGRGMQATGGGTLTVIDSALITNSITATGGRALSLDTITIGDAGLTLDTVNVTAGQYGLYFVQVEQTASSTGIDILDGSIAVSQSNGTAVWVQNSSADVFVGADLSSSGSANTTVNVSGNGRAGGQGIEFAGLVDENTLGIALTNNDQNGGYANVTFSGTVDIDTASGASYGLSQSDGGNLSVTGPMSVDTVGSTNGIQLQNNTGSTLTFNSSGTGLDINTAGGTGLLYTGGGTLAVLGSGNTIETATGNIVDLQNGAIGASGVTFASLTATGTASLPFFAYKVTGGTFDGGALSIAGASGLAAMQVLESSAGFAFDSIDILSTATNGIIDNANTGDLTVTGKTTVVAGSYAGVRLEQNHGTIDFGETEINGVAAGVRGLAIGGTFDGSISFDSLVIALTGTGAIGVDMHNAVVNANVTATDFDLTSTSATGTVGIDLTGANGTGTVQFGDASTPYGAGQNATISGVATGVSLNDASDIEFIFGDSEGSVDVGSSISATTAIDFTDATGANGTFNFLDVTFPSAGSTANLESAIDVYWIDAQGDGNGSQSDPGSFDDASALSADVLVLANTNGLTTDTIDLASTSQGSIGSYTLLDGQVLVSFNGSDTVDLTDYGFSGGGAPANLLLTNISTGGTTLTNPYTVMTPELDSLASPAGVIQLADGSNTWIDGVVFGDSGSALAAINGTAFDSFTLTNSAIYSGGLGIDLRLDQNGVASTSQVTISDTFVQSAGTALLFSAGLGDSLTLDLTNVHARGTGSAALDVSNADTGEIFLGLDGFTADGFEGIRLRVGTGATGDFVVTDFAGLTLDANSGNAVEVTGLATNWVKFDAVPGTPTLDAIDAGNLTIGADGSASGGLSLTNIAGQLDFGDIDIQTTGGTGLSVNNSALKAAQPLLDFTLTSTGGTINSINAPVLFLDPLTVNMTLDSVSSSGGGYGIQLDEVAGTLNILGGTITGTTTNGVRLNASTLDFDFAGTIANATGRAVEIAGQSAGTVTFSGAIDAVGTGILLSGNTGATINFTGGLDIDTGSNTGFVASGGTLNVTGTNTIETTTGRIFLLSGISAGTDGINFDSLTNTGTASYSPINLSDVDGGTVNLGDVTIAGVSNGIFGYGINFTQNSAATFNIDSVTLGSTSTYGIFVDGAGIGPITIGTVDISASSGAGVYIADATGSFAIDGGTIGGTTPHGVYITGGSGSVDIAAAIDVSSSAAIVNGHTVGDITFSGNLDGGISVSGVTSGAVNFTGQNIVVNTGAGPGVSLVSNTGGTINFNPTAGGTGLDIITTSGTGFSAYGGGTITVAGTGNTIQTATGQILNLSGISSGASGITFASLTSTGTIANHAIYLNDLDGTSFSGGDVTVAATSSGGNGLFITGGSAAAFDFGTATIGTTGAVNSISNAGIYLNGANGSVTFDGVDIDGFQNWGLRIDGNTNAVIVNGGTINAENLSGGAGVLLNGGSGNVTIAADVTKTFNQSAYVVQVSGRTAGTATFSGDVSALTPGSGGIGLANNSGGAIDFTGAVTLDTFNNNAIDFTNTSATGAAVTFSGGLDITTTSGRGINATSTTAGAGSLAITGSGNTIQTATGQILNLSNISAGAGGINFASLTSGTVASNHAIRINNLDGTSFSGGAVTIGGTTGSGHGIYIAGGSGAAFTFASATMENIAGDGIYVEGSPPNPTGAVTFGTVDLDGIAGSGVHLSLLGSTFAINGGTIGATDDPDGFAGVFIDGGAGDVSIAASIVKDNNYAVEVNAKSAGITTFSGNITAQSGSSGIFLNANTGGTINFTGQSISVNTGANTGVNLTNNTGAVINFSPLAGGSGLDIITTSGTGFNATGGGTVTVTGSGNTIASTGGTALNVSNTNIGAAGLTFESISANGGTRGIVLNTTGSAAGLTITGTGTTDGSGGTIQNITQRGIELINTAQVNIANLNLTNASTTGQAAGQDLDLTTANGAIYMSGVSTAVFDNINITGTIADNGITGINVSNFQLNNSLITGAGDGAHESGIEFSNLSGTSSLTNTEIAFSETNSLDIVNTDVNLNLTLNNVIFRDTQSSTTNGEGGLQFRSFSSAAGAPVTNIAIIDSDFLRLRTQAIQVIGEDDSVVNVDITNNVIDSGTGIGAGIDINGNDTATVGFNIIGNSTIRSSGGAAINISSFLNANVMGRIANNADIEVYSQTPAVTGASGSGVRLLAQENSHLTVAITGNNLTQGADNNSAAVEVIAREGSARLDLTLTGNIITQTDAASLAAINLQSGSSSGSNIETNQIYANIANNSLTVPGGVNLLRLRVSELDNTHDPRIFLQGFVEGGVGLDDDAVATWNANGNTPGATAANVLVSLSGTATAPSAGTAQTPTNPLP